MASPARVRAKLKCKQFTISLVSTSEWFGTPKRHMAGLIFIALGAIMAASSAIGYLFIILGLGFIGYAAFTYSLGKRITQQE
jgi:hypothetical protein